MDSKTFYGFLLIIMGLLYIKYYDTIHEKIWMRETFRTSKTQKKLNKINKTLRLLRANIVDLASIAKHNTSNICRISKSIAEVEFHEKN